MVGHGGSSAGSYLADPTSPIPSHCASIVMTSTVRVNHHSLCFQLYNVTGLTVMLGLSSGCDTIFSQTFGSLNKHKLGVALQRGIVQS